MPIPDSVISEIKYRNDIEEVISAYVDLKRRGKNLVGLCPFHNEKTPSFTIYPENGSFYCFGCKAAGDVISFIRMIENLDYVEAVKLLAERSGVMLPQDGYDDSMQRLKNTVFDINREAAHFFHDHLMSPQGKWALDYLTGRGLSLATIRHFGLGAAPDAWDSLLKHLQSKGYSVDDMLQANVIAKSSRSNNYYDRFHKRVIFPVINIRGKVVAFSGRAMPGDEKAGGKYVNTADTPVYKKSQNLFGMNFAKTVCSERVVLVEGNMDVVSLHQAGFTNTVAALGTAFGEEQVRLLSRYTKEIVLALDSDTAGQEAVRRVGRVLRDSALSVRVAVIPDGKDPDEFIRKHGAVRFGKVLDEAVTLTEYYLAAAMQGINVKSDAGRLKYLNAAAQILADTSDGMTRDLYIGRLSESFQISRTALESKIQELRHNTQRREQKKEIESIIAPRYSKDDINPERRLFPRGVPAEETLIAVLMQHPDLYTVARDELPSDRMLTSLNRRIYQMLIEHLDAGREADASFFGERLTAAETGYLVSLQNSEKGRKNAPAVLRDCIQVILEEGMFKSSGDAKDMTADDWAENMKKIIEKKQKGK